MGLLGNTCSPAKNDPVERTLSGVSSPPLLPFKKKHPQPTQNGSVSNVPSPIHCPRDRSHDQSPSTNPVQRTPAKGFTPQKHQGTMYYHHQELTSQTLLSSHGNNDRGAPQPECDLRHQRVLPPPTKDQIHKNEQEEAFPYQAQPWRDPFNRTRLSTHCPQSGGPTHPSIPLSFHQREEKCPEASSQDPWIFFLFYPLPPLHPVWERLSDSPVLSFSLS